MGGPGKLAPPPPPPLRRQGGVFIPPRAGGFAPPPPLACNGPILRTLTPYFRPKLKRLLRANQTAAPLSRELWAVAINLRIVLLRIAPLAQENR